MGFGTHQTQTEYVKHLPIDFSRANMVECPQAQQSAKELLIFPIQVPQPEWLVEAMMNMNKHIVTYTNEEILDVPLLPAYMNEEFVHYYVDLGVVEEVMVGNEVLAGQDATTRNE